MRNSKTKKHHRIVRALACLMLVQLSACEMFGASDPVVGEEVGVIAGHRFGESREPLATYEQRIRQASDSERAAMEDELISIAASPQATREGRQFACRMLRKIGTERSIPVLAKLLDHDDLSHMARFALQGMPSAEVDEQLRQALADLDGDLRLGVIDSVAARGDRAAVPLLVELVLNDDDRTARAAISGLGRIGGRQAADVLTAANVREDLNAERGDALLRCADGLLKEGDPAAALSIYQSLRSVSHPVFLRVAAWRGSLRAEPDRAIDSLAAMFQDGDRHLARAAAGILTELPDETDTAALLVRLPEFPEESRVLALGGLAARGDPTAAAAAVVATESDLPSVRRSGLEALGRVGDSRHVGLLVRSLTPDENDPALVSLSRLRGDGVDAAIVDHLQAPDEATRVALVSCLVKRRAQQAVPTLIRLCSDESPEVRTEAIGALGRLADSDYIEQMLWVMMLLPDDSEREQMEASLLAVSERTASEEKLVELLVKRIRKQEAPVRASITRTLGALPTDASLAALERSAADPDAAVRQQALRALAAWPDAAPSETLLGMAQTSADPTERVLALEGYLAMSSRAEDLDEVALEQAHVTALLTSQTAAEKVVTIRSAGNSGGFWALEFLQESRSDPELSDSVESAHATLCSALARKVSHDAKGCSVTLAHPFVERYSGGDDNALTDGVWGSDDHRDGHWQGFKGDDVDAVIDLGQVMDVHHIRAGFLENRDSWIFAPSRVEFQLSEDGTSFRTVAAFDQEPSEEMGETSLEQFYKDIEAGRARYVRVHATNVGTCPGWHPGSGQEAWLFADEIQVNPHLNR